MKKFICYLVQLWSKFKKKPKIKIYDGNEVYKEGYLPRMSALIKILKNLNNKNSLEIILNNPNADHYIITLFKSGICNIINNYPQLIIVVDENNKKYISISSSKEDYINSFNLGFLTEKEIKQLKDLWSFIIINKNKILIKKIY